MPRTPFVRHLHASVARVSNGKARVERWRQVRMGNHRPRVSARAGLADLADLAARAGSADLAALAAWAGLQDAGRGQLRAPTRRPARADPPPTGRAGPPTGRRSRGLSPNVAKRIRRRSGRIALATGSRSFRGRQRPRSAARRAGFSGLVRSRVQPPWRGAPGRRLRPAAVPMAASGPSRSMGRAIVGGPVGRADTRRISTP